MPDRLNHSDHLTGDDMSRDARSMHSCVCVVNSINPGPNVPYWNCCTRNVLGGEWSMPVGVPHFPGRTFVCDHFNSTPAGLYGPRRTFSPSASNVEKGPCCILPSS